MKKYRYYELNIEITRKCNKRCAHCMRGEAQPLTMSEEIIDRVFDEVQDVKRIVFGNGEALLEVERISYFIDKLVKSQWSTQWVEVTTNGILCEPRIIDIFEQFCLWLPGRRAHLRISNDQYHSPDEYENAYAFYKPLVEAANERIRRVHDYSCIELKYIYNDERKESGLSGVICAGRAVELAQNNTDKFILGKNMVFPYCYKHRIKIIGDTIPCALGILANGNITFSEPASYEQLDDMSIGDLKRKSLVDLIDEHNERCLLLCSEAELMWRMEHGKHDKDLNYRHLCSVLEVIYNGLLNLRSRARELFPHVPAQIIIERLPFPDPVKLNKLMMDIYKHCPLYTENMIINIKKYTGTAKATIYIGAMCSAILISLKDKGISSRYPSWLFGDDQDVDQYLTPIFEDFELRYEADPQEAYNNKVYPCEPGEYGIVDYSEEVAESGWDDYSIQMAGDNIARAIEELKQLQKKTA